MCRKEGRLKKYFKPSSGLLLNSIQEKMNGGKK